jgi:hypothetical protein
MATFRSPPMLAACAAALAVAAPPVTAHDGETRLAPGVQAQIAEVRRATARFHDIRVALDPQHGGYGPQPVQDLAGKTCIAEPGKGAMGVHYVNGSLLTPLLDPLKPQALMYEPQAAGLPRLVGVEYIVFKSVWEMHAPGTRPRLFGRDFHEVGADNRYGLPPFYALHLWLWQPNRSGMFADWNPAVACPP